MDENRPLDVFLQPSRRLLLISVLFVLLCAILFWAVPLANRFKLLLLLVMLVTIVMELRTKVFLTSSNSIIRIGCEGGIMDANGHVSDLQWWFQRRCGERVNGPLYSGSRVWAEWVALDFARYPWQLGYTVVVARDSVENADDFQRLKRLLRSR